MKSVLFNLLSKIFGAAVLGTVSLVLYTGDAAAVDARGTGLKACGESFCSKNEGILTVRIAAQQDGSLHVQTVEKGQTEGPAYILLFAEPSVEAVVRDLIDGSQTNSVALRVVGSFVDESRFLVTSIVSGGRSGVSIGSQ